MPPNISVQTVQTTKDKVSRCNEWFALAEHGKVFLVNGPWVEGFLESVELFDGRGRHHDDEIDAVSIGFGAAVRGYTLHISMPGQRGRGSHGRERHEDRVIFG